MGDSGEALLKRVYYEKCPGCKLEQRKEANLGLPVKELFYVWLVTLCTSLPISSLFPFLYFMIRDFHIAKRVEDIGYYAGYVGSAFMFGRTLTSIIWGMIADRYGRKPVIVIGIVSVVIFNTLFGLSTNFWMALSMRFLLGSLNGLLGPIKAYAVEVTRKEHHAIGLSLVSTAWGIGLIIGPAVGGFLAQPAEKYPNLFSNGCIFARFPYFLPCLVISLFAVGVLIVSFWLPETLHMHHEDKGSKSNEDVESVYHLDYKSNGEKPEKKSPRRAF
ncbi:Protein ZINC INDUCED FACILITATOR-LIKE 1 [Acorus calamus]|uniref:Protein ZINC INDUCED FACILITATOR-LIKE 1 n=1 Tax=Acorus calamus TaxID=4465 RepID=A0AAV9EZI4_ACOCL|nr:Protein ZINC INDUCED FACILITATOR-LIKE 1 [Acorus calamus]